MEKDLRADVPSLLLINDDATFLWESQLALSAQNILVATCEDPWKALEILCFCPFDHAIMEVRSKRMSGIEFARLLRKICAHPTVLSFTAPAHARSYPGLTGNVIFPRPLNFAEIAQWLRGFRA